MKRIRIIDFLKASGTGAIQFLSKAGYAVAYVIGDLTGNQFVTKDILLDAIGSFISITPVIYNLPANSETPVIINFEDSTIKIGTDPAVDIGTVLTNYQKNPSIKFEKIIDSTNSEPVGNDGWITNKEWFDNTYNSLKVLTLQPDTDTGEPGGLTLDNINVIIKA